MTRDRSLPCVRWNTSVWNVEYLVYSTKTELFWQNSWPSIEIPTFIHIIGILTLSYAGLLVLLHLSFIHSFVHINWIMCMYCLLEGSAMYSCIAELGRVGSNLRIPRSWVKLDPDVRGIVIQLLFNHDEGIARIRSRIKEYISLLSLGTRTVNKDHAVFRSRLLFFTNKRSGTIQYHCL